MGDIIIGPYLNVTVNSVDIDGTDTIDIDAGTGLLSLDSATGSITMGTSLMDDKTLTLGPPGATQMVFTPSNTASSEKISLTNTSGTANDAISLTSTTGGITLTTPTVTMSGALSVQGDITGLASDKRLKKNIKILSNPLDKLKVLSGFTYDWSLDKCYEAGFKPNDEKQIGVFAQDVQSVIPEAVKLAPFDLDDNGNSKSGDNYLTVQYEKIVPLLIESIKEQQKQINELRNEVELLKK
jgi:hypothetical protein